MGVDIVDFIAAAILDDISENGRVAHPIIAIARDENRPGLFPALPLKQVEIPRADVGSRFHPLIELGLEALQLANQVKQRARIIGAIGSDVDHGPRNLPPGLREIKRWTIAGPNVSLDLDDAASPRDTIALPRRAGRLRLRAGGDASSPKFRRHLQHRRLEFSAPANRRLSTAV
jgi:hypothetical protein